MFSCSADLFLAPVWYNSWHNVKTHVFCFILILEVKWPSCTSGSNRWQRQCSLVVLECDENLTLSQKERKKRKKITAAFRLCVQIQKWEPEIV